MVRDENQDSLLIEEPADPGVKAFKGILIVVADGMGGLEEGSTASRLAVEAVRRAYYESQAEPKAALDHAVNEANRAIFEHSHRLEDACVMGSTLTALAIVRDTASIAQVGDSRAYSFRKGALRQITKDHSLVRELADRGEIDEISARYSVHRNVLTRGLGLNEKVPVDLYELHALEDGDTILLSSDGMHSLVHEDEIAASLEKHGPDLKNACDQLVKAARERGGPDNITVAIARVSEEGTGPSGSGREDGANRGQKSLLVERAWILPLVIFLSFAAGVLLTLWLQAPERISEEGWQSLRQEVDSALKESKALPGDKERAESLREHLERVKRTMESK
jgi:protein phosphatase